MQAQHMNTIHRIHCQEPWFSLLKSGEKPVEGRKNSPVYQKIIPGDIIEFFCGNRSFRAQVVSINKYLSLDDYLISETIERALPGVKTIEDARNIYYQWSSQEQISKNGFLGIQIKVI